MKRFLQQLIIILAVVSTRGLFATITLLFLACSPSSREGWLRWSRLRRAPAPPALVLDLVVDGSADGPGTPETVRATTDVLAPPLLARGGLLRVWGVGESTATSTCYLTVPVARVEDAGPA